MNKAVQIGGAVVAGAVLLGGGILVGRNAGQADADPIATATPTTPPGALTASDQYLLQAFMAASKDFDELMEKARKGNTSVGPKMTKQAVIVLTVERNAANEQLKAAAGAAAEAMLLIGAGMTANDNGAVQDGVSAYQEAQTKVVELANMLKGETASPSPTATEPAPSPTAS